MKFSKKILETFIDLPDKWVDLMEDVGAEIKSVDGDIFNVEILANRGDHYCYAGLATEISGRTGTGVRVKESLPLDLTGKEPDLFAIDTDKCLAYSLMPLTLSGSQKNRQTKDGYIKTMLPASGVNLILDVIDITNVVMLEVGQPAHVYDADKIVGKIHIRETKDGESAALLFHDGMTALPAGTMVIADDENILCVAGVIGCRAAEVDENTKNILFETALFDPVSVRKTAKALGLSSIASQIFERGGNIAQVGGYAVGRALKLYNDTGWEQSGDCQTQKPFDCNDMIINLSGDYVRAQLEIEISDDEITKRLARYGFVKTNNGYRVPSWRVWDIKGTPADLIEELCRSIGYNALPSRMPRVESGASPTMTMVRKNEIDSYLTHNGFLEVITDSLYSKRHANLSPVADHIALENSVDGGYAFLKNNAIVQATELVSKNLNVKTREIRGFEWGKVFQKDGEHDVLWGVMNGANISALTVKGLIENLLRDISVDFEIVPSDLSELLIHPKRGADILIEGKKAGFFGEIHPSLLAGFDIKNDLPVYFEFLALPLWQAPEKKVKYESPSAIIPSVRDISIAVPYGRAAGDVAEFIEKKYPAISHVEISDVYDKPKENIRNVTFSLTFAGTHSAEELNALLPEIMTAAHEAVQSVKCKV